MYESVFFSGELNSTNEEDYGPNNDAVIHSMSLLDSCRKFNIISTIFIVIVGLIGHFLTIFVYSQQRFRINSSNVYLLCLSFIDGTFLIIHFFEVIFHWTIY